jgi:para-nitrobenzyl esterase
MSVHDTERRARRPRILTRPSLLDRAPRARASIAADTPESHEQDPAAPDLLVDVESGTLRGRRDGALRTWRGIPYAEAPTGDLRFRAPRPARRWDGVRDATEFGPIAPQPVRRRASTAPAPVPIDEDCLTANVQTPLTAAEVAAGATLPVLVFIHGGGYTAGSSRSYRGRSFTSTGRAVYVSFNYRLGPLGYLDFTRYSTDEHPIESNLGLRDQVALLEWVQRNIARFGGDPSAVTVFGESAGGGAVTALLGTPSARGLFARAIAQSPPPSAGFPASLAAEWAEEFVEVLRGVGAGAASDSPVSDPSALLRSADVADLLRASQVLQREVPDEHPGTFCFAPTVDGDTFPSTP